MVPSAKAEKAMMSQHGASSTKPGFARASTRFVQMANKYRCNVMVRKDKQM